MRAGGEPCLPSAVAVMSEVCPLPPAVLVWGPLCLPPCPGLGAPVSQVCPPPHCVLVWGPLCLALSHLESTTVALEHLRVG